MSAEIPPSAPAEDAAPASEAVRSRERAFSLLHRANRWLVGLAVLLAGALTALTAHAFHARPATAQTVPASRPGSTSNSGQSGAADSSQLQPPASAPTPAPPAPAPPVVSGGS